MHQLFVRFAGFVKKMAPCLVLVSGVGMGLSSCSMKSYPVTPEVARNLKPGQGFIVATFAIKGMNRSGERLPGSGNVRMFVESASKGEGAILLPHVMPVKRDPYFAGGGYPSEVVAIPMPAGDYEITGWSVTDAAITTSVTFRNRLPMRVPFKVNAGEATYVGRANSISIYGKNLVGMQVPGEALVILTDEFATDAARISKFYPSIRRSSIRRSDAPAGYKREMQRTADTPPKFLGFF